MAVRHSPSHSLGEQCSRHDALHASERGTNRGVEAVDSQRVHQQELAADHILHGHKGEGHRVLLPRRRVDRGRPRATIATTNEV